MKTIQSMLLVLKKQKQKQKQNKTKKQKTKQKQKNKNVTKKKKTKQNKKKKNWGLSSVDILHHLYIISVFSVYIIFYYLSLKLGQYGIDGRVTVVFWVP